MITLHIKRDFLKSNYRYIVKNNKGEDIFLIIGKRGRIGDSLTVFDMKGNIHSKARQTILSFLPSFDLYEYDVKIGTLSKRLHLLKGRYYKVNKLNWRVVGDFKKKKFSVTHHRQLVMKFHKTITTTADYYHLTLSEEEYAGILCLIAIIIDDDIPDREAGLNEAIKNKQSQRLNGSI